MKHKKQSNGQAGAELHAATAADLMTATPVSLRAEATLRDAIAFFAGKGFSAAPVIDDAGRPIGVLSQADVIAHECEDAEARMSTRVSDMMTPAVLSVTPETAAGKVVEQMVALQVHRLVVGDRHGVLIGVISAFDGRRRLVPEPAATAPAASRGSAAPATRAARK